MHIVIIEWDGRVPPTTYYNRMHSLGLYVRGDKDEHNPLVRRDKGNKNLRDSGVESIIFQEGCVVCSSEKLARVVAEYARENGAKNVQLIDGYSVESHLTPDDAKIIQRLEGVLGKRGRPQGDKTSWTVTCYEECITSEIDDVLYAVNCPVCKSPHQRSRPGNMNEFAIPPGDIFLAWSSNRFATGTFEVPKEGDVLPPILPKYSIMEENKVVVKMLASPRLRTEIEAIALADRKLALRILDSVFCGRCYISPTSRKEARLRVAMNLYEKGVDQSRVSIIEDEEEFDMIDGANISPERIAGLWLSTFGKDNP